MKRILSSSFAVVGAGAVLLALIPALAPARAQKSPHVCQGTFSHPGVLSGRYPSGVVVKGACAVNNGKAHVIGTVTVNKGGTLAAVFGQHKSALKVTGNVVVNPGGAAVLGCKVNADGSGASCLDDPNQQHPTLTSHAVVTGSLIENAPLGVIVHNSTIGGNVSQTGGGGGVNCKPVKTNPAFSFGVFSDYEDSSIGGHVVITDVKSCWLGFGRVYTPRSVTISRNEMADPDAIEIFANYIGKNLTCRGNSHPAGMPPGDYPVWDSGDISNAIYPRRPQPNTVEGTRSGQCVHATPTTQGGPSQGLF